jgi:hypothetical protein
MTMHDHGKRGGGVKGLTAPTSPEPRPQSAYPVGTNLLRKGTGWVPAPTNTKERLAALAKAIGILRRDRGQQLAKAAGGADQVEPTIRKMERLYRQVLAKALISGELSMDDEVMSVVDGPERAKIGELLAAAQIAKQLGPVHGFATRPNGSSRPAG